ncbi:hypothetical protein EVAR_101603_1 [Eumeta japonica]|uniref:Uncharacterized protein n=1 Tax=Eumeta variegata TaxID=151549 RepID=A0A4C1T3L4_EUMVA|nr:hypothetical protein EVAR_101603_1 [Eumeta japonica]
MFEIDNIGRRAASRGTSATTTQRFTLPKCAVDELVAPTQAVTVTCDNTINQGYTAGRGIGGILIGEGLLQQPPPPPPFALLCEWEEVVS